MKAQDSTLVGSRPLGVAREMSAALDPATIYSRKVILTGEPETLTSANGRWCLLNAMRLLSRVVGRLVITLPDDIGGLMSEAGDLAAMLWSQGTVEVRPIAEVDFTGASAILNIGHQGRQDLPWTSINSNGWVGRCTSTWNALPPACNQANPLGAMLAASAGVAEIFKRVYGVPTETHPMMDCEQLSLFSLDANVLDLGPALPEALHVPSTLMVGAGAIGNALILLWSQLPLHGRLHIIDKQAYAPENYGTCCLLDEEEWIGKSKAEQLAAWLQTNAAGAIGATGQRCMVGDAVDAGTLNPLSIDLLINGLDDNTARHDAQRLWPTLTVDGAINSMGAAVVTHSLELGKWACLQCTFPLPQSNALQSQAQATGLAEASLVGGTNRQISDADIEMSAPDVQDALRSARQQGVTLCSVMPSLLARQRLGVELEAGFRPSVPFVASAAAALTMAQALRQLYWPEARFIQEFQIADLFKGFYTAVPLFRQPSEDCLCSRQRSALLALAKRRRHAAANNADAESALASVG